MALKITSITRLHAAPCQHFRVVLDDGGTPRTVEVHLDEVRDRDAWQDFGPVWGLVLLWARYKLAGGATVASLVNVEIA